MKLRNLLALLLIVIGLSSCKEEKEPIRIGCDPELKELMLMAVSKYSQEFPDQHLKVYVQADGQTGDSIDITVFKQDPGQVIPGTMMARRAILSVFSSDHPNIQNLARNGSTLKNIASIYNGEIRSWNELNSGNIPDSIRVISYSQDQNISKKYLSFLGVETDPSVYIAPDPQAATAIITNSPLSIGFLYSDQAFDGRTGFRRSGLYILPIDFDNSGRIEDAEYIYDNLNMFSRAVNEGRYASELVTDYCFNVLSEDVKPELNTFIEWYFESAETELSHSGFIFPEIQ